MPKIITENQVNQTGGYIPVPTVTGTVFSGFTTVMNVLSRYTHPVLGDCQPTIPPPFFSVNVGGVPIHYGSAPLNCGVANVGIGEVYCYERVPDSSLPLFFILFPIGGGGSNYTPPPIDTGTPPYLGGEDEDDNTQGGADNPNSDYAPVIK
jgi:hypothetical protein